MEEKKNKLDLKEIRNELEEIAFRHDKRFKLLTFSIFFLVTLAIGISTYTLHYLLRFDAEEIDTFVSGNLKRKNAKLEYSLPRMALALLAQSKQKVSWNPSQKKWFFENASGKRVAYDNNYTMVGSWQIQELERQHGIVWNGDNWVLPQKLKYLRGH